eukprot:2611262-Rhodomonas_salina.3
MPGPRIADQAYVPIPTASEHHSPFPTFAHILVQGLGHERVPTSLGHHCIADPAHDLGAAHPMSAQTSHRERDRDGN